MMRQIYKFSVSNTSAAKQPFSFRGLVLNLFLYSVLVGVLQVWPIQEIKAQNFLDNVGLPGKQAVGAYSVRKLSSTYNGNAIRVRRTDNAQLDIGFTAAGDLDQAALLGFVGTGNGFVVTWYDQSGNGKNVTQATAANQPRLVSSGVLEVNGTVAAIKFSGGTQNLINATVTCSYPVTISLLANISGTSTRGAFVKLGTGSPNGGIGIGVGAGGFTVAGTSIVGVRTSGSPALSIASPDVKYPAQQFTSTTIQQTGPNLMREFLNGSTVSLTNSSGAPNGTLITGGLFIGSNATPYPAVKESEVIVIGSALSTEDRLALENNQQNYYSILTASVGPTQNICNGLNSSPLLGNTPAYGLTGRWSQQSGPGTTTFSSLIDGAATATVSEGGSYVYRWLISNGISEKFADITVNYSEPASTGIDQHICNSLTSDSLGGSNPIIGVGQWIKISGPGVPTFIPDANSPNATVSVTVAGNYTFQWMITGGICSPSTANIDVNLSLSGGTAPTSGFTGNATICPGASTNLSVALTGAAPWNLSYSDGADVYNVEGILSSPYTFSVSPILTTTYKITSLTDANCKAQVADLATTILITVVPKVSITPDYCSLGNGNIKLTADTHDTYLWSNGAVTQFITVNQSGFYSVKVTDAINGSCEATNSFSLGDELVFNGDFSLGNVGFVTQYGLPSSVRNCGYVPSNLNPSGLYPAGTYNILIDPQSEHCNFFGKDHTTGTGKFMVVNGAGDKQQIWRTNSVPVKKNTRYYFSAWAMSLNTTSPRAALTFKIGNYSYGDTAFLNPGVNNDSNNGWVRFFGQWDSGDTTSITISIVDTSTASIGNDFGIDDISFSTLPPLTLNVAASAISGPTFCTGESVDLVPVVDGGWSPLSYNWTYGASQTSTLENPNIPSITVEDTAFRLIVTDDKGCKDTTSFTLVVDNSKTWLGVNTDWFDAINWCGGIPDSTNNVTIPNLAINPVISAGTAAVKNLTINGGLLNISGGILQIAASVTNTGGIFDASGGAIEFNGLTAQTIKGSWFKNNIINSLIVTNAFGLSISGLTNDSLNILDSLVFGADNATLNTGDNLVLVSNDTATARLGNIEVYSNNTISGKVSVQRYFPALRSWRLVTAPLANTGSIYETWQNGGNYVPGKGVLVTGPNPVPAVNGLDYSLQNTASLKAGDNFVAAKNTRDSSLSRNFGTSPFNIGYYLFVRGDRDPANTTIPNTNTTTISSKGTLQTGTQTFNLSPVAGHFSLVGNPYASPVDLSVLSSSNIERRFVFYDPNINPGSGAYVYVEDIDGDNDWDATPDNGPGGQDTIIQSSQAFFVQTSSNAAASLVFEENNKATKNNLAIFRQAPAQSKHQYLKINLFTPGTGGSPVLSDGVMAEFDDQANAGVDMKDALKFTNVNETFSLQRDNRSLAVERRPVIISDDTLFLHLTRTKRRGYRFEFIPNNLDAALLAFLEDKYTASLIPLDMVRNSSYDFVINADAASAAPDRFRIVFKTSAPLPVTFKSLKASQQGADIAIDWMVDNEINISKYEVEKSADGVNFVKVDTTTATGADRSSTAYSWLDINPVQGNNFYRIRSISPTGAYEFSRVVMVKMGKGSPGISVFPNPVTNGIIGVQFKNLPQGIYNLRVINQLGQVITTKKITHTAGTSMETITIENKMNPGVYQLEVIDPGKNITTISVIAN